MGLWMGMEYLEPQTLQPPVSHYMDNLSRLPLFPVHSPFSMWEWGGGACGKEARDWHDKVGIAKMGCWADVFCGLNR